MIATSVTEKNLDRKKQQQQIRKEFRFIHIRAQWRENERNCFQITFGLTL